MPGLVSHIHELTGGTERTRELYELGLACALTAINSDEFEYAVKNYKFIDPYIGKIRNGFHENSYKYVKVTEDGFFPHVNLKITYLNRAQIYNLIMSGWDKYDQKHDGDMDIEATIFYKRWSSSVGYTYSDQRGTWINTKFWTGTELEIIARIAANIVHEYMHNLGFGHDRKWNPLRDFTVPYAIGTIVHNMILGTHDPDKNHTYIKYFTRTWRSLWLTKETKWRRIND